MRENTYIGSATFLKAARGIYFKACQFGKKKLTLQSKTSINEDKTSRKKIRLSERELARQGITHKQRTQCLLEGIYIN